MCDLGTSILAAGGLQAGSSLLGGLFGSSAAQTASKEQAQTARQALDLQSRMFNTILGLETPFVDVGRQSADQLATLTGLNPDVSPGGALTGALTTPFPALQPFAPTMEQLAQTPGYQFTLGQGLQSVQNAYAAQGLGSSGAALKGAANYAEGLAGTTFQQQFQNYLQQQQQQFGQYWTGNQNVYNMLSGLSSLGAGAASAVGGQGVNLAGIGSQTLGSLGAAQASGTIGSANALIGGFGGAASAAAGTLPAYSLAPLTTAALASIPGMYTGTGYGSGPGGMNATGFPLF